MRESADLSGANIPAELLALFKRIDCNASIFGMTASEVAIIKKECKIAFQHKTLLDKIAKKKK